MSNYCKHGNIADMCMIGECHIDHPKAVPAAGSTHFNWSIEKNDACPVCHGKTVLISAHAWVADSENKNHPEIAGDYVEVNEEITGHWCPPCGALRSLSLNS